MTENSLGFIEAEEQRLVLNKPVDIFYSMLLRPIQTLDIQSNISSTEKLSLVSPILIIIFTALSDISMSNYSSSVTGTDIAMTVFASLFGKFFFWNVLSLFLYLLAALLKRPANLRACYAVTGWSFVPLLFKAVATCFSNATIFGDLLSCSLSIWFLVLELFAFDSVLRLGRIKTLGLVLILPPCLFFAYFISMIFAATLISNSFI